MKEILSMLVSTLIVLCSIGAAALPIANPNTESWNINPESVMDSYDEIDQNQSENGTVGFIGNIAFININISFAQSFIPQKRGLTRVELLIRKNSSTTYPYMVAIRDDLAGEDLVRVSVPADEIPTEIFGWVEFDFDDIIITTGQMYYIVCYTKNITDNFYWWAANDSNLYPNGDAIISQDDGESWLNVVDFDMCFRTYGMDVTELAITIAHGLGGPRIFIENIGDYNATEVEWEVDIGGIIRPLIGDYENGSIDNIASGEIYEIDLEDFYVGLGFVDVEVIVVASNAPLVIEEANAFVLLFFFLILP